jgi:preprotein translocase subunit SecB
LPADSTLLNAYGQLLDVEILDLTFRRNRTFDPDSGLSLRYSIDTTIEKEISADRQHGVVDLHARFDWHHDDPDSASEGAPFDLTITVSGIFRLTETLPEDELADWLEFNTEHLLWPYLRSEVAHLTAMAGLPSLTIYTIATPRPRLGEPAPEPNEAHG